MTEGGAEAFQASFDVSRETMAQFASHLRLLEQWNPRINLVSAASLGDVWTRHFADSAQLWRLRPSDARIWVDLGSGAGFPGLVVAALSTADPDGPEVHLVESDQRKAAFLSVVIRTSNLRATVHPERVEQLRGMAADVVSARALASLDALIGMAEKHRRPGGIGLFHKGASVHKEIADAAAHWHFDHVIHPSLTDSRSAIVEIGAARRV